MFLEKEGKVENLSFSRSKMNQTWFFECKSFFKIWQVWNFSIQNLTRCISFHSKSNAVFFLKSKSTALFFLKIKIWHLVFLNFENFFSNRVFKISLSYHMCYQHQRTFLLKWHRLVAKSLFMSVWHVFASHLALSFWYCILKGIWVLDGCDDYIFCTTIWLIQFSSEFWNWLFYKDFNLKDTKLLVQFPWPSRKQSTIYKSSNSNIVFLTSSLLSANTDLLLRPFSLSEGAQHICFVLFPQDSVFRDAVHSVNSSVLLVEMICTLHIIKNCPLLTTISPMNWLFKIVYRQSRCWLKQNAPNFCSNSLTSLISIMWYLQLGKKHILSLWRAIKYSILTTYFSYVVEEIERPFFEGCF